MEELSENADRIWILLSHNSQGYTVKELLRIFSLRRTVTYYALKELKSKGFVSNENGRWKIIAKPSPAANAPTEKPAPLNKYEYKKGKREYEDAALARQIKELESELARIECELMRPDVEGKINLRPDKLVSNVR